MSVVIVIGNLRQSATLTNPSGPPTPDGDGGFTQVYAPLVNSPWRCAIQKVTLSNAEKHFSQAIIAHATHVFNGRFNPEMNINTRATWTDYAGAVHVGNVIDIDDTEGAGVETVAAITEVTS